MFCTYSVILIIININNHIKNIACKVVASSVCKSVLGVKKCAGAMHFICCINRLTTTKVDSTYLG